MHYTSYLGRYGIESTQFLLPIDRVLFNGFTSSFAFALWPIINAIAIALLVTMISMLMGGVSMLPAVKRSQSFFETKVRKALTGRLSGVAGAMTPLSALLFRVSDMFYRYAVGIFFIVVAIYGAVLASTKSGADDAEREKLRWIEKKSAVAVVKLEGEPSFDALPIICGTAHCAYWTGRETRVLRHEEVKGLSMRPAPT
ncbi:hypothetical protein [Acidovorax sp.]|uniref:hypothetical protein n=1 Tax=Acidovorax sp. TaxID=1872122 RepID=UPI00391F5011